MMFLPRQLLRVDFHLVAVLGVAVLSAPVASGMSTVDGRSPGIIGVMVGGALRSECGAVVAEAS